MAPAFDFQGEPASYTPNPFMMVMEKGQLLRAKAAAPATKKPAKLRLAKSLLRSK